MSDPKQAGPSRIRLTLANREWLDSARRLSGRSLQAEVNAQLDRLRELDRRAEGHDKA